jgi:hypothetical protein
LIGIPFIPVIVEIFVDNIITENKGKGDIHLIIHGIKGLTAKRKSLRICVKRGLDNVSGALCV